MYERQDRPHHGRRHRRPHLPRSGRGRGAACARLACALAGGTRQHGGAHRATAWFCAGDHRLFRCARQGPRHAGAAAPAAAARLLAGLVRGAPGAAGCGGGPGRLHQLSGRHDGRAGRQAAGAARAELGGWHGQQGVGGRGRSRVHGLSGGAQERAVGGQPAARCLHAPGGAARALCGPHRAAAPAGGGWQPGGACAQRHRAPGAGAHPAGPAPRGHTPKWRGADRATARQLRGRRCAGRADALH